jgi:hypothetical protein
VKVKSGNGLISRCRESANIRIGVKGSACSLMRPLPRLESFEVRYNGHGIRQLRGAVRVGDVRKSRHETPDQVT